MIRKVLIPLIFLFCSQYSFSANQYVDPSFLGTSDGSITNPWKNFTQIVWPSINAGDSVLLKRGNYFSGGMTITRSGSAGNFIVVGAYGSGDSPILWGNGSDIEYLIRVENRSYVKIRDISIIDTTINDTARTVQSKIKRAISFLGTTNNCYIENCIISKVGVGAYVVGDYNGMLYCDVGNLRMVVNDTIFDNDYGANPIVIEGSNNQVKYNYFHDCWAISIDYGIDGGAIELYGSSVSYNKIGYNRFYDCNGVVELGHNGGGLMIGNEFLYNEFLNNGSCAYISNSGTFAVDVKFLKFYNNTIIESEPYRLIENSMFALRSNPTDDSIYILKNNIIYLYGNIDVIRSGQSSAYVHENNLYKLGTGSALNFTLDASELLTTVTLDSIFIESSGTVLEWNYHLQSFSPARGLGQDLSSEISPYIDLDGIPVTSPFDAGVYQFVQPSQKNYYIGNKKYINL